MTTASNSAILDPVTNPVLTVAPQNKEDTTMSGATNKITALYCRLSQEDARLGESLSIVSEYNFFFRVRVAISATSHKHHADHARHYHPYKSFQLIGASILRFII